MKMNLICSLLFLVSVQVFAFKIDQKSALIGNESEITQIDFSNQGLTTFPAEILKCTNLVELDLSGNGIVNFPAELGKLKYLKKLNLSNNQGLSFSDMDAVLARAEFQLTDLNLAHCEMLFIPTKIGMQKQLVNLNLENNRLRSLPYHVIQLAKMERLNLSNNQLNDISWQVNQWWSLKELDVSNNPTLKTDELIVGLSYADGLDKLVLSDLNFLPKEFEHLNVKQLEIKNAFIDQFPRTASSSKIQKLVFENCKFKDPKKLVETFNAFVSPRFLSFQKTSVAQLIPFFNVNVDSISLQNNGLTDLRPLALKEDLVWVDARNNPLDRDFTYAFIQQRPDISLFKAEPIAPNKGVSPPVEKFVKPPTIKTIDASKAQTIELGKSTIAFAQNSFLDVNGKPYTGSVELAYTEYSDPVEILFSGITMASDSANENLMFSSAGMFNLTAQDENGNPLELAPDKPAEVSMFSSNPRSDMNLYFLDENGDWKYEGKDEVIDPFKIDLYELDSAVAINIINMAEERIVLAESRFVPKIRTNGKLKSFEITFDELKSSVASKAIVRMGDNLVVSRNDEVASLIAKTSFVYDGHPDSLGYYKKALKYMRRKSRKAYNRLPKEGKYPKKTYGIGINYIRELDVVTAPTTDNLRLVFAYKDSMVSIPVVLQSNANNSRSRMTVFNRFFKKYDRQKIKRNKVWRKQNKILTKRIKLFEEELKGEAQQLEIMRQYGNYNRALMNNMIEKGSFKRNFQLPRFGVWNCDARSRMVAPFVIAQNFIAKGGNKIIDKVNRMMVIDFDRNGIINFEGNRRGFFDRASNSAIVVFFAGATVGIYRHVKDAILNNDEPLSLEILDLEGTSREVLKNRIQSE